MHPRCGHEVGERLGPDLTHKRFELFELFLRERRSPEPHGVVALGGMSDWTSVKLLVNAEELEVQVIETRKMVLRQEHSDTLTSIVNLAVIYKNQERWKETEKLEL